MAKITSVQNGDSGLVSRNKINTSLESVEVDGITVSGNGNVGTELNVLSTGLNSTQIPFTSTQPNLTDTNIASALNTLAYLNPNNIVIINQESDFPAVVDSFIELEAGKNYLIADNVTITNPIKVKYNNTIYSAGLFQVTLTYSGGGDMFVMEQSSVHIRNIFINCPNARIAKATDTAPLTSSVIFFEGVRVLNCDSIGEFTNVASVVLSLISVLNCVSAGVDYIGNIRIINLDRFFVVYAPTDGSAVVDLGTASCPNIEFSNLILIGDASCFGIKGLVNSGNIPVGFKASVRDSSFDTIVPLQNIQTNDIRWEFHDNAPLQDSISSSDAFLTASQTVPIITQGVFEEVDGGNWSFESNNRFSIGTDGVVTYLGENPLNVKSSGTVTVDKVGGGSDEIEVRFAKNWTAGDSGELRSGGISRSTQPSTIPLELLTTLSQGDTIRIVVANNGSTSDVNVLRASLVITRA